LRLVAQGQFFRDPNNFGDFLNLKGIVSRKFDVGIFRMLDFVFFVKYIIDAMLNF
jgi:hypothetical protein